MKEQDIYALYQGEFKEIYADLVAVLGNKPTQIVFELEAALSHIAVAKTNPALNDENLEKAFCHIQRAALDAAKMLWLEFRKRASKYVEDGNLRKFCSNVPESEFVKSFEKAERLAFNARKTEIENVGKNPMASIKEYYAAALEFKKALEMIDPDKIRAFSRFSIKRKVQEHIVGFAFGVASGIVATMICSSISIPSQSVDISKARHSIPTITTINQASK
ncbi:MAG: hypothetical protein BA870_08195 [Desulfuromonadales bacterium C00003094]|jgi:hypothetical protein|nr:MAG: hypothetical protein BA870_08195 [Desulfuromonadales bacterium C00003094]